MDITNFVVSSRQTALLYGDHSTYRGQLSKKLLNSRKKLSIVTKNRSKYNPKGPITAQQVAENHEYVFLQLLTAERAWAQAMYMKAAHSTDTKGMSAHTRSHIISRLERGAKVAENLANILSDTEASGASSTDILESRAYAALLRGATEFEKQKWEACLKSYAVARTIYAALSTSTRADTFKDLLSEDIDPAIRYAAYQAKIPRTEPVPAIARNAFLNADAGLTGQLNELNPDLLKQADGDTPEGASESTSAPATITWRSREVKIEDAAIAVAWAAVGSAKSRLADKLSSSSSLRPRDMAAAYDEILLASQDAVDATKQAIDELKGEGVTQSDPRMQSLQITRTAVNYEAISWRIGRNRVLAGEADGATVDFEETSRRKKSGEDKTPAERQELPPGRQIAKLKEKVVLYDGTLQSIETILELPGVANDQDLSSILDATSKYFIALKCLAIARSHSVAGNDVNALALVKHALDQVDAAAPVLAGQMDEDEKSSPLNIKVTESAVSRLSHLLNGELQRSRALVEISRLEKKNPSEASSSSKPLVSRLSEYPSEPVNLENIVTYPPQMEAIPVKPLFLDVAWNYIDYPDNTSKQQQQQPHKQLQQQPSAAAAAQPAVEQPKKRGWFGFGR